MLVFYSNHVYKKFIYKGAMLIFFDTVNKFTVISDGKICFLTYYRHFVTICLAEFCTKKVKFPVAVKTFKISYFANNSWKNYRILK